MQTPPQADEHQHEAVWTTGCQGWAEDALFCMQSWGARQGTDLGAKHAGVLSSSPFFHMNLNTLESSAPVSTWVTMFWHLLQAQTVAVCWHRGNPTPNQRHFGVISNPLASSPQKELHCLCWLLCCLLWSRAEPWMLCYRGVAFSLSHCSSGNSLNI